MWRRCRPLTRSDGPTGHAESFVGDRAPSGSCRPGLRLDRCRIPERDIPHDPAATEQVSAITDTGVSLVTYWAAGFRAGTDAERVVRDPAGQVVVAEGEVLEVGQRLHGYFVCLSTNALYVLIADPS